MRRIINYDLISEKTKDLKFLTKKLLDEKDKILLDINKINDSYKGKDADLLITKYQEKVNYLNEYIENMNKYILFFEFLTGSYKENTDRSKQMLDESTNQISDTYNN